MPKTVFTPEIDKHKLSKLGELGPKLSRLQRGIEKEGLRVKPSGQLSMSSHPKGLGSALTHAKITTDFSESQLELITGVHSTPEDCLNELDDIQTFVCSQLEEEILWPSSMPCNVNQSEAIPLAQYGTSNFAQSKTIYRRGLGNRYGRLMQTISGIHYNFSLPEDCWQQLGYEGEKGKTQGYFDLIRNFRRWSWLLIYLFGTSPAIPKALVPKKGHEMEQLDEETFFRPHGTSLRMGPLGYQSSAQGEIRVSYNSIEEYIRSMKIALTKNYGPYEQIGLNQNGEYQQLNTAILQIENEFYGSIRPKGKTQSGERTLTALETTGVEYVEVRCIDLDPHQRLGIDAVQVRFLDTFLLMCLLSNSPPATKTESEILERNQIKVIEKGRLPGMSLQNPDEITLSSWGNTLLEKCDLIAQILDKANQTELYTEAVNLQRCKLEDQRLTPSYRLLHELKDKNCSMLELGMQLGLQHKKDHEAKPLTESSRSNFDRQSLESLSSQQIIEEQEEEPFDDFLKKYTSIQM